MDPERDANVVDLEGEIDEEVADMMRSCAYDLQRTLSWIFDTSSSNSRQNFIETGRYLTHEEQKEWSQ
jgi:hypothetical protein